LYRAIGCSLDEATELQQDEGGFSTASLDVMDGASVPDSSIVEVASVDSGAGERLSLRYAKVSDRLGSDFFELAWLRRAGVSWEHVASLSAAQFQAGCETRRWVSNLHSFCPGEGKAILQVAETTALGANYQVAYSWRAFSWLPGGVVNLQLLQHCTDPFEPYANDV
jgi:hypothetical protein